EGRGRSAARVLPKRDLGEAAEAGAQAISRHGRRPARRHAVQHIDVGGREQGAERHSLRRGGDEEGPRAGSRQGRGDPRHAEPIGIRLDRGRGLGRPDPVGEQPPILDNGTKIDREDGTLVVFGEVVAWSDHARQWPPRLSSRTRLLNLVTMPSKYSSTTPIG